MKVTDLKINGIKNPVGFSLEQISCSWKVTESASKKQQMVRIVVATDEAFTQIVFTKEGQNLQSIGEKLDFSWQPRTRYFYTVEVTGEQDSAKSQIAYFEGGKGGEAWVGKWIGTQPEDSFHPVFFKEFPLLKEVAQARLYVSGLGVYEAYLNGEKVGNDYLAPFCNDYHKQIQYQTYDVLAALKENNCLQIFTGNGWYKGRLGFTGDAEIYGNKFAAIAELVLTYLDGTMEVVATDDTWYYQGSDVEKSDLYDGETFNRLLWQNQSNDKKQVVLLDGYAPLVERYSVPVVVKETLPVKKVIHTPAGETVLDFGQNFTGYVSFENRLPKGSRVTLEFGEILQQGNFYRDNYRSAKAAFIYVSDGRRESVRPHFTYFGFRYVRLDWKGEVDPSRFQGRVVYSDLHTTIQFESGHAGLNQLASNCLWGQKSNFLDMPTDCPQRDERLGWTGDAQVFAPTAVYQMDARAFYEKYLRDLRIDQLANKGAVANYLPNLEQGGGSSVWGDAATFLPMALYHAYGDKTLLKQHFPMMQDWVDYVDRLDREQGGSHLWNFGFHFGDWLALDGMTQQSMKGSTEDGFVASMYYYASTKKVAEAAEFLENGLAETYEKRAQAIYEAILQEYFTPNGRLAMDTQTAYLLSLRFGVYRDKEKVLLGLKNRLKKDAMKIKGGFVGATTMCQVLAQHGMEDVASYILLQRGYPGWMHCIDLGATTIWERWNSVLDDGSISETGMNSLNHYAYGAVMEYVYSYIAGIQGVEPGFRRVRFAPQPIGKLSYVKCTYESVSGSYQVEWKILENGNIFLHLEVPFSCSASVILPGKGGEEIQLEPGIFEIEYQPDCDYRCPYNMDTRLEMLKDDDRALVILKEELPIAYYMTMGDNPEQLGYTFQEMKYMNYMGFDPISVEKAAAKIIQLKLQTGSNKNETKTRGRKQG